MKNRIFPGFFKQLRGLGRSGQSQLLGAVVIGGSLVSMAMFGLELAKQVKMRASQNIQRSSIRTALDLAAKQASFIYRSEASCVPATFNAILNRLDPASGSIGPIGTTTRRQWSITESGRMINISFGTVAAVDPGALATTLPQDATLELWASMGRMRVSQRVALINTCAVTCANRSVVIGGELQMESAAGTPAGGVASDPCLVATNALTSYHQVDLGSYPTNSVYSGMTPLSGGGSWASSCWNGRRRGELDYRVSSFPNPPPVIAPPNDEYTACPGGRAVAAGARNVSPMDLAALRNYVRSGDPRGSCTLAFVGTGPGANAGCADLNADGVVDSTDVGIMEKQLRGYLYWSPVLGKLR